MANNRCESGLYGYLYFLMTEGYPSLQSVTTVKFTLLFYSGTYEDIIIDNASWKDLNVVHFVCLSNMHE
jgi:hypothetical protein